MARPTLNNGNGRDLSVARKAATCLLDGWQGCARETVNCERNLRRKASGLEPLIALRNLPNVHKHYIELGRTK